MEEFKIGETRYSISFTQIFGNIGIRPTKETVVKINKKSYGLTGQSTKPFRILKTKYHKIVDARENWFTYEEMLEAAKGFIKRSYDSLDKKYSEEAKKEIYMIKQLKVMLNFLDKGTPTYEEFCDMSHQVSDAGSKVMKEFIGNEK